MEHFHGFPTLLYDPTSTKMTMTNIFMRARVREAIMSNKVTYYNYRVTDDDSPEIIADKWYGSVAYTWIVFYANNIVDPQFDWPLNYDNFHKFLHKKYRDQAGTTVDYMTVAWTQSTIHHYVNDLNQVVSSDYSPGEYGPWGTSGSVTVPLRTGPFAVSYYDMESAINEDKRDIKVIDRIYLTKIINEFNEFFR